MTLSSRKAYLRHVKLHDGSFRSCEVCDKVFARADILKDHKRLVHGKGEQVNRSVYTFC